MPLFDFKQFGRDFAEGVAESVTQQTSASRLVVEPLAKNATETAAAVAESVSVATISTGRILITVISCATALAVGTIAGVGADLITLVDRWSVLASLVLYLSVILALLSPVLAIPRTLEALVRRRRILTEQEAQKRVKVQERAKAAQEDAQKSKQKLEGEIRDLKVTRAELNAHLSREKREHDELSTELRKKRKQDGRWFFNFWSEDPNKVTKDKIAEKRASLTSLGEKEKAQKTDLQGLQDRLSGTERQLNELKQRTREAGQLKKEIDEKQRIHSWQLLLIYGIYFIVSVGVVFGAFGLAYGALFTAILALAIIGFRVFGVENFAPSAIGLFLVLGLVAGRSVYGLDLSARAEVDNLPMKVRFLMNTSEGVVVLRSYCGEARPISPCDSSEREVAFIPRSKLGSVTLIKPKVETSFEKVLSSFNLSAR